MAGSRTAAKALLAVPARVKARPSRDTSTVQVPTQPRTTTSSVGWSGDSEIVAAFGGGHSGGVLAATGEGVGQGASSSARL